MDGIPVTCGDSAGLGRVQSQAANKCAGALAWQICRQLGRGAPHGPAVPPADRRIRELRQEQGHAQEQFADKVGVERAYMSNIETGKNSVGILIRHIAEALKVPLSFHIE